jgi:hypothetical protein
MLLMGTTTLPKKLLLLPVPLFLSFWIVISKSPGSIESSGTRNSNCTSKAISLRLTICRTSLMQKTLCAVEQECHTILLLMAIKDRIRFGNSVLLNSRSG